jgi:[protein-PII] uridylyltransferase
LARANLEAETSFLLPRLIGGDRRLYDEFRDGARATTVRRRRKFARDVQAMINARHDVARAAESQQEPNLKSSPGGLRDLLVLRWHEALTGMSVDNVLIDDEHDAIEHAEDLLHRARAFLHYTTERQSDVLAAAAQRSCAHALGYKDDRYPAEHAFMREIFLAMRAIERICERAVADLVGTKRRADAMPDVTRHAALVVDGLGGVQSAGFARALASELRRVERIEWTHDVRVSFFRMLRRGDDALRAADDAGLLHRLLPGWDAVRAMPQQDPYHRLTVDLHAYRTVEELVALADDDDPVVKETMASVDLDDVLLAGLLHDIGKGRGEDHAVAGESIAREMVGPIGLGDDRTERIVWLVRHHLLLVEAATRRDLSDENFIVDVTSRIGDPMRARMLYLLSIADGRATGPTAWSAWKASLLRELFVKVMHVFEQDELASADATDLFERRAAELRAGLGRHPAEAVDRHISMMPRAYVLSFPSTAMIRHYALMTQPPHDGEARDAVTPGGEPGVYEYTVCARDRPGLLAASAGALALNGVNILDVKAFTRVDGAALQAFRCVGAFESDLDTAKWARVSEDVRAGIEGRLDLGAALAGRQELYGRARVDKEATVVVDTLSSDFFTVIEVHASDRVGLLFDVTSTLAGAGLDVSIVKVATQGAQAVDAFYVRDVDGHKVTDHTRLAGVKWALLTRLSS